MADIKAPVGELQRGMTRSFAAPRSRNSRYRFRHDTIVLQIEEEDGVFIASDSFSTVFGTGASMDFAVDDYLNELYTYVEKLEQREAVLARGLREELATLRQHVEPAS